jgi:hypothetical protein
VIAYALLEDMVPHFNDPNGQESAMKLLHVIGSRARKNLHLVSNGVEFASILGRVSQLASLPHAVLDTIKFHRNHE